MNLQVDSPVSLTEDQVADIGRLILKSPGSGGNPPLSEDSLIALRSSDGVSHFTVANGAGDLLGYGQVREGTLEFVSESGEVSSALVNASSARSLWAHGQSSAAESFAAAAGWIPSRQLLQLRRTLAGTFDPDPRLDSSINIRAFRPGQNEAGWLELNSAAFAHHPEQGGWTAADLAERLRADWFDPAGFLLAERDATLLGFHWTKVHAGPTPIGEVYVLGVHPAAQGQRLGQILLNAGLRYLQGVRVDGASLSDVLLYVEADNAAAVRLYEKAGFSQFSQDTQYRRP